MAEQTGLSEGTLDNLFNGRRLVTWQSTSRVVGVLGRMASPLAGVRTVNTRSRIATLAVTSAGCCCVFILRKAPTRSG
jgi:hypothetical protein